MPSEDTVTQIGIQANVIPKVDRAALTKSKSEIKKTLEGIDFGKIGKSAWGIAKGSIGAVAKTSIAPIKKMGSAVFDTTKRFTGFFSAIKRIAIYRAIRSALKAITQGLQEGRQNAYQWAVVTGNQFARSMDMMATSALYLKNSLGAMTMPLTNYLAPILDRLIDQFVELINIVNRFIATITGASSWVKALKYPAEYMEQAAGSAKELKNQLLGFDDLNILNAPKGSGSGMSLDYSNMFQKIELEASKVNFTKSIMQAIKNSDWDKLEELLDEHINGMIEKLEPKKFANALGEKLNKAIRLIHTLLKAVDFQQIGSKIGEFISNLKLDWNIIGRTWATWATNIADTILGLLSGVNWGNVAYSLGEYIKGLFGRFTEWLNEINWSEKGEALTQHIYEIINAVDWKGVASALWEALKVAIKAALNLLNGNQIVSGIHVGVNGGEPVITYAPSSATKTTPTSAPKYLTPQAQAAYDNGQYQLAQMLAAKGLANGGFPKQGTYFYAGEAGAEVVAQIGGRTGVYNADQMAGALASANVGVVNTLTAVGNAIVGAINRKDMTISTSDMRTALNGMNVRYGV